jgi:hypothetical protein
VNDFETVDEPLDFMLEQESIDGEFDPVVQTKEDVQFDINELELELSKKRKELQDMT